jgi:hypothetical protein
VTNGDVLHTYLFIADMFEKLHCFFTDHEKTCCKDVAYVEKIVACDFFYGWMH